MDKSLPFQISAASLADIDSLTRIQILADRRMDVLMQETSEFNPDIAPEDMAGHTDAWTIYFNKLTQGATPDPLYQGLKAERDGQIVGCVFTATETKLGGKKLAAKSTGCVEALFVHPDFWSQGIATGLMTAAVAGLKNRNVKLCTLWAEQTNDKLDGFYQHLGWKRHALQATPMKINGRESFAVLFERHI